MTRLVLASASPRRRELMTALGYDFEVVPADLDEEALTYGRDAARVARRLARAKALHVASQRPEAFVLAGDTVVFHRGDMLGKPVDADEARRMLNRLAGQTHRVVTGVAVMAPGSRRPLIEHVSTRVHLRRLGAEEIEASIAKGDPFDKAGAYAIQDAALRPIAAYEGCFCNVMGLPSYTAQRLLEEAGLKPHRAQALPEVCNLCPLA
jgi:MAF protein